MADSLFDNRYRYDYIYPRGRSGETLRAIDTASNNRKVVIKRPALNDAPPIRAGQEVSIVNERRALQRLSGHPVLTALVGEGQFVVGGMPHQYIVMERAEGIIISELVAELNASGERMAELEMLVILDSLLDLLHSAHSKDIIYNDVDAKHLFWNRDEYALKLIDWGNAIFLEGDEVTPQGISRQTDIYQVGELMFSIVTGGRRAEVPRDAGDGFRVDFGDDNRRVHSRLQEIISKALHPNSRLRYSNIAALRGDLMAHRMPIERERNATTAMVNEKLKRPDLSMSELRTLRTMIEPALKQDPGHPITREAHTIVVDKLRDIAVEADLDAVRIYMQSASWTRAMDLLRDLRDKAGSRTGGLMDLLQDICLIMNDESFDPVPPPIAKAVQQLFEGRASLAAETLLDDVEEDRQRSVQWQIAERISSHIPEVLLLRPNLYRLNTALRQVAMDGYLVEEPRSILAHIDRTLEDIANGGLNLAHLRDGYRSVVEQLSLLNPLLQTFAAQHQLSSRRVPINALERALNAAMALADGMHVIGKQAASSPRDALNALDTSRAIDPINPIWGDLEELLDRLYDRLQVSQTFVPAADGSDLLEWLQTSRDKLRPFIDRLFDENLSAMADGLEVAQKAWNVYQDVILNGNRDRALTVLNRASDAVQSMCPALAQWFRQLRSVVEGANYAERHALPGGLGRALADGWAAFDRGRLSDAERLGQQAHENARTEAGRFAATRLQTIASLTRDWVERNGVNSDSRTKALLESISPLFTADEATIRHNFESQMPSIETYLKAMSKGLIAAYQNTSTAALRLLFVDYIAQGTLDVHEGRLQDGEFWRDAAVKSLPETGDRHIATRTLDEYISRRRDLLEAGRLLAQVNGKHILPELANVRRQLENNPQSRLLASGIQSLRDVEVALRDWSDGDFRSAGLKLDDVVKGISETEQSANIDLSGYRAWLMDLMEAAARLTVQSREMRGAIEKRADVPDPVIEKVMNNQVSLTESLLGEAYTATLRQWRDTYEAFVSAYTSEERRTKRLERLNELFRALFIDSHPAYPLYRHWYMVLEASSEFPAPPTNDPTPRVEADSVPEGLFRNREQSIKVDVMPNETERRLSPMVLIGGIAVLVLIGAGVAFTMLNNGTTPSIDVTITMTPEETSEAIAVASDETETVELVESPSVSVIQTLTPTEAPVIVNRATNTPRPTNTDLPTATETPTSTNTPVTPTATPTNTYTPTVTNTVPPATRTPLPAGGLTGRQDMLALLNRTTELIFNPEVFAPVEGGYRLGIGVQTEGDVISIIPPAPFLEQSFGERASNRIRSVEATMALTTFNPTVIESEQSSIFFGLAMESVEDGNNAGIQIEVVNNNVINIYEVVNNNLRFLRQRAINAVIVRLRLDRDINTGAVTVYLNDEQIGDPITFIEPQGAITPVLFVKDGGVIVTVSNWVVILR